MNKRVDITIFIPTYFAEDTLAHLLRKIFKQKIDKTFEVLIYDTSSTDKTPKIIERFAKRHANLRHKTILKKDFQHGRVRQQAAEDAKGEFVVYLTQDAIPAHNRWLYELLKPFEINEKSVGVTGKQDPRPKTFPLLKREIRGVFSGLGPDNGTTIYYKDDFIKKQSQYDHVAFYSDVNSACRRNFVLHTIPYRELDYAEDQAFGRDVIEAGYMKAYASRGNVVHSNEFKIREYKNRMFDEVMGLRKAGIPVKAPSFLGIIKVVALGTVKDTIFTLRDSEYSWKRRLFYIAVNPIYNIEKWRGFRKAVEFDLNDQKTAHRYSLESRQARVRLKR